MAKSKKKGNMVSVDLSDVESSGRVSAGEYLAEVISIENKTSSNYNPYLNWKLKAGGGTVYHTTSLQPQALWNLRGTLEACGFEVPDDQFDLDLDSMVGAEMGILVETEEYRGKPKPTVVEVFTVDNLEGGGDSPDAGDDPDSGGGEDLTYDDVMAMDKEELLELAGENDIKVKAPLKKNLDKLRAFLTEALELEEEPAPKKGKLKKGAKVEWEDEGETYSGKVTSIDDDVVTVVDGEGDEWELDKGELTLA